MSHFTALAPAHRALAASMAALACAIVFGGELGLFAAAAPGASSPQATATLTAKAPAVATQRAAHVRHA